MLVARGEASRTLMPLLRWVLWAFLNNVRVPPDLRRRYYEPATSRIWRVSVRILARRTRFWDSGHSRVLGLMRPRRPDVARHFSIIITVEHLADPLELVSTFLHEYVHAVQTAMQQTRREFGHRVPADRDKDERQARVAECMLVRRLDVVAQKSGFCTARALIEDQFERLMSRSVRLTALVNAARAQVGIEEFVAAARARQEHGRRHTTTEDANRGTQLQALVEAAKARMISQWRLAAAELGCAMTEADIPKLARLAAALEERDGRFPSAEVVVALHFAARRERPQPRAGGGPRRGRALPLGSARPDWLPSVDSNHGHAD